jgi:transcriptional regulator with XRE-family HTH domain
MGAKKSAANQALGEAIRSLRREQGYAQEAFAARTGLDRSHFGVIERGELNVGLDTIVKVAAALGTKPSTLLSRARM